MIEKSEWPQVLVTVLNECDNVSDLAEALWPVLAEVWDDGYQNGLQSIGDNPYQESA